MRWTIALLMVMFACSAAQAEVYEWLDGQGVVHLTDQLDKVPARYREKVKRRESASSEKVEVSPTPAPHPMTESAPREEKVELYGGHDRNWWQANFKALRVERKDIQDKLPEKKETLAKLHHQWVVSMGRTPKNGESTSDPANYLTQSALSTPGKHREAYYDKKAEIEKDEARITEIGQQLDSLEADADRGGVPFEWRK
jgi:Domain of unknown function (DUF4124)